MKSPERRDGSANGQAATGGTVRGRGRDENAPGLDRIIQAQIGDKLRTMYGELVEQPMPDKFAAILDRLSRE